MEKRFSFKLFLLLPFLVLLVDAKIYWLCHFFILVIVFFTDKLREKNTSHLIILLVIPLLWSFLFSFEDNQYSIIQALFYLTTPFMLTLLGIKISRNISQQVVFRYILFSGTIGALYYLSIAFINFGFSAFTDPYSIRSFFSWGSITSVVAIILIFYSQKFGVNLIKNKKLKYFIGIVNLLALYFTASRTYYLMFIIFLLFFLYKTNKKKLFFVLVFFTSFWVFFLASFSNNTFLNKIESSSSEIRNGNYQTDEDINTKYRGYETKMALETYLSGNDLNLVFGHGFEKLIDLKTNVELAGTNWSKIPILHNGYMFLLIREGFAGLIFFLVFFAKLYRLRYYVKKLVFLNVLIAASIVSLLISNYAVGSFFSMEMADLWILFGVYIGYVEIEKRKRNNKLNVV